jgi:hypothetical protein
VVGSSEERNAASGPTRVGFPDRVTDHELLENSDPWTWVRLVVKLSICRDRAFVIATGYRLYDRAVGV